MNALANHLWQSTCFALVAVVLVQVLRNESARVRYAIWLAASLKFLVPFSWLISIGSAFSIDADSEALLPLVREVAGPLQATPLELSTINPAWTLAIGVFWLGGAAVLTMRWIMQHRTARRLVATSPQCGSYRSIPIHLSKDPIEPGLVGLLHPAIVISERLAAELSPRQLHVICAHEWWHARRYDNLTASLHACVRALFWFHPLVWWLGRRLLETREQACDEAVVAEGHDATTYATSILRVCRLSLQRRCEHAVSAVGGDLKSRVQDILNSRSLAPLSWSKRALLILTASATVTLPVMAGVTVLPNLPDAFVTMPFVSDSQESAVRQTLGGRELLLVNHDRISVRNLTLRQVIGHAYRIEASDVQSDLAWIDERYDIDIRLDAPLAPGDQVQQARAIRTALARHFNLQILVNRQCEAPCGRAGLTPTT